MNVKRIIRLRPKNLYVGDAINFRLTNKERVAATAVRVVSEGMLFMTDHCVGDITQMFQGPFLEGNETFCYAYSDLRQYLKDQLLPLFPEDLKSKMVGMKINGTDELDLLRIPTEKEIFGENIDSKQESQTKQFLGTNQWRYRVAFNHKKDDHPQPYWLQNNLMENEYGFLGVDVDGNRFHAKFDCKMGVRLIFCLPKDAFCLAKEPKKKKEENTCQHTKREEIT